MEALACAGCNLVTILCNDIYKGLSYNTETSDEEIDILA